MRYRVVGLLLCGIGLSAPRLADARPPTPHKTNDRATAVRVLNRFAFGPTPGQVEQVQRQGVDTWFERQLTLRSEPVSEPYRSVTLPPLELVASMASTKMVESGADERVAVDDGSKTPTQRGRKKKSKINFRRLAENLALAQLTRHVRSEHQLVEVMVDFWANHFNVFARKGNVKLYAGHYVEHAIRPHVLGRFEDLLTATAQHPAMLLYLDNAKSRAPLTPKALEKAKRRNARRVAKNKRPRRLRDLNENYARELLELHTVVKHSQTDVVEAARVLTGWGVQKLDRGGGFIFKQKVHDAGTKVVLGRTFGPGHQAGLDMLKFLARHPATGRHLGEKLCRRFVSDAPSSQCIDAVAMAHQKTDGNISAMLRAVYRQVVSNTAVAPKLKTPLEYLVSALRILNARPTDRKLARALKKLGQPTLMMPVPTGYPEVAQAWNGSTSMLRRLDIAAALGRGKLKGIQLDLSRIFPKDSSDIVARIDDVILHGLGRPSTLATIRTQIKGIRRRKKARRIALTLALGSPEFMSQ